MFYCKVHRKRLEQKERETHDIAEWKKKKKKLRQCLKRNFCVNCCDLYADTQETTFKAVFNYCILNPFASNTLFDELKRVMSKATLNVGIGFDIKCTVYYFQTLMNVRTIPAKMELFVPTFREVIAATARLVTLETSAKQV